MFIPYQKMFSSTDSLPCGRAVLRFVGVIMNSGNCRPAGQFCQTVYWQTSPGSLSYTNIVGNMMFGAISGSAIAHSTSIGGVMVPMSAREGYDRGFAARSEYRASAPTGMLIPPTTAFILYALASGEHRLPLFAGGLVAGCCGALFCMLVTLVVAKRRVSGFFTVQKTWR